MQNDKCEICKKRPRKPIVFFTQLGTAHTAYSKLCAKCSSEKEERISYDK